VCDILLTNVNICTYENDRLVWMTTKQQLLLFLFSEDEFIRW